MHVGVGGRRDVLKCDEMVGIAGATMVTSTAARKFGRTKPRINFHRRAAVFLASCRNLSFSSVFSVGCGSVTWEDWSVGAVSEVVRVGFVVDRGEAFGDR